MKLNMKTESQQIAEAVMEMLVQEFTFEEVLDYFPFLNHGMAEQVAEDIKNARVIMKWSR